MSCSSVLFGISYDASFFLQKPRLLSIVPEFPGHEDDNVRESKQHAGIERRDEVLPRHPSVRPFDLILLQALLGNHHPPLHLRRLVDSYAR